MKEKCPILYVFYFLAKKDFIFHNFIDFFFRFCFLVSIIIVFIMQVCFVHMAIFSQFNCVRIHVHRLR